MQAALRHEVYGCPPAGFRLCRWGVLLALIGTVAHSAFAQPLSLFKNYFVTGDYIVAGWRWDTTFTTVGGVQYANGKINIPDTLQPAQAGVPNTVPNGATIVAAFLYWQDVEKSGNPPFVGQNAFFNGYAITGTQLGSNQGPTSWSSGGCAGANTGSKTLRSYRADVRPYLLSGHVQNGTIQYNGPYTAMFADSGKNQLPYVLGATLVIVYRVFSPAVALNSVVIYDGAFYPNNSQLDMTQQMQGFYQAASPGPAAKLTHIVGNGQTNKNENVYLQGSGSNISLPPLYPGFPTDPFPGVYVSANGTWDNPTWVVNIYGSAVQGNDSVATASVIPTTNNAGCVTWGATILSTTVQDTDNDGLLDVWEQNQGYVDVKSGISVALPNANPNVKDIFVEVDFLQNLDGNAGPYLHSHLPKQQALDKVGDAFANAPLDCGINGCKGVHIHFDVGNVYQKAITGGPSVPCGGGQCDPYIVPYSGSAYGGNSIPEREALCIDSASALCAFPGTTTQHQNDAALGWKGGFLFVKNNAADPTTGAPLGNFEFGRKDSYHYVLFAHALGMSRSLWRAAATLSPSATAAKLISIVNLGSTATVTIQSPATGMVKPGDCPNSLLLPCSDANADRVTVTGALGQTALNGTYHFANPSSTTSNNVTTTTFNIATANVASGTYSFSNEPELRLGYLGPTSTSGQSDPGGGDSAESFGLWPADNTQNCNADPSLGPPYCNDQVGTVQAQAGTLMHELGHTLTLAHGGTYYSTPQNFPPGVPTYGLNCRPNFLSGMSYLFQIRGFPDNSGIDYSRQTLQTLDETQLSELTGLGSNPVALHFTRWYARPNASSGSPATAHCDGTPLLRDANDNITEPQLVRVDCGGLSCSTNDSSPIDWNNDLIVPDTVDAPGVDVNFNGTIGDGPFLGFNDWNNDLAGTYFTIGIDLRQIGTRLSSFGFSVSGALDGTSGSGGVIDSSDGSGGTLDSSDGSGGVIDSSDGSGGAVDNSDLSGGAEVDFPTANSTVDAPILQSATWNKATKSVNLTWSYGFGQIRTVYIYRMTGAFTSPDPSQATLIQTLSGAPPTTSFSDSTVKQNTTYTYYLVDQLLADPGTQVGRKSGPSNLVKVTTQ